MSKFELGKSLAKTGDYIGNNKKPLLYIGGAIALVMIGYAVVKRIKGAIKGSNIVGGRFNAQDVDLTKTTITKTTAKNYAENLFEAFNFFWGTDKSSIDNIFSRINSEDFKLIYNAFGKRSYGTMGTPVGLETLGAYTDYDLITWINNELDFGDSALREKIRKIVEPAGFVLEK